jgi:hypothetical protein
VLLIPRSRWRRPFCYRFLGTFTTTGLFRRHFTELNSTELNWTELNWTELYRTVLYCTVLYCLVLNWKKTPIFFNFYMACAWIEMETHTDVIENVCHGWIDLLLHSLSRCMCKTTILFVWLYLSWILNIFSNLCESYDGCCVFVTEHALMHDLVMPCTVLMMQRNEKSRR